MPPSPSSYRPDPRWLELAELHDVVAPARFPDHILRWRNDRAAEGVGLHTLTDAEWLDHFARFEPLPDNLREPLALRYHGHQFGHYNAALGDGRGFLFAQLRDADDRLLDLGTKGSGPTPYARNGDGRLTLQGAVREILAAELLEARGVPTCRILSVVETGEALQRHDEPSPTRSAVLVRLSHSHVRIGTFQRLAFLEDHDGIAALVAYVGEHLLPGVAGPVELLRATGERLLDTCAAWMAAGFVHGVLNTDNLCITGESFDYGPWRFTERWDPRFTAAYFDHGGFYAFGRQPWAIGHGLVRLAGALSRIAEGPRLQEVLTELEASFDGRLHAAFRHRLGLPSRGAAADAALGEAIEAFLATGAVSIERFVADWGGGVAGAEQAMDGPAAEVYRSHRFDEVRRALTGYEGERPPVPDDHLLIDQVRRIWSDIADHDDWTPLVDTVRRIRRATDNR